MNYSVRLDTNELDILAKRLDMYATRFEIKVDRFLKRLAELSIEVARVNEGDFAGAISYTWKYGSNDGGRSVVMIAKSDPIVRAWYVSSTSQEPKEEVISPLLMAEFGSGHYAIDSTGEAAGLGGQGTLKPSFGHAADANGWYWWTDEPRSGSDAQYVKDVNGRIKYHSYGQHPSQPLHNAVMACIAQVEGIANEVFG